MRPKGPELLVRRGSAPAKEGPPPAGGVWGWVQQQWVRKRTGKGSGEIFPTGARRKPRERCPYSRKDKLSIPAVPRADPGGDPPG